MNLQPLYPDIKGAKKQERLEARVHPQLKMLLQHAADLQGQSLTDFIVLSAEKAAKEAIRDHSVITLSAKDSLAFAQALLNPPKPNRSLRAAFARYQREVVSQP